MTWKKDSGYVGSILVSTHTALLNIIKEGII